MLLTTPTANAQFISSRVKHAVNVLKNLETDITKEEAFAIIKNEAKLGENPEICNYLGLAYMYGCGVKGDSVMAVKYLESAAERGIGGAYHNLGMMYKYSKCGVHQDMYKAYEYFCKGAKHNNTYCMYDKAYMLYKGLGCKQDYKAAGDLFYAAAMDHHNPSLYMLGLCYRNGYGVEADSVMAFTCQRKAAAFGNRDAKEELERPYPENYLKEEVNSFDTVLHDGVPDIYEGVNDMTMLSGQYHGFLLMYDWSGKYILEEKPLTMNVKSNDGSFATGTFVFDNDTVPFSSTLTSNGKMTFTEGKMEKEERYEGKAKVKYRIDNAIVDVWQNNVRGRLNLYSLKAQEPERPMYFELYHSKSIAQISDTDMNSVTIYPNPFSTQFKTTFNINEPTNATVRIFNKYGMMVWQQSFGTLNAGNQEVNIRPNIPNGTYVMNIKAGKHKIRSIIIKNGGE